MMVSHSSTGLWNVVGKWGQSTVQPEQEAADVMRLLFVIFTVSSFCDGVCATAGTVAANNTARATAASSPKNVSNV